MQGSKMVLLVPDAETRERIRGIAFSHPISGLQASFIIADEPLEGCVRDTRRVYDGPLAVLSRDGAGSLVALAAGADEALALDLVGLSAGSWRQLVARTQLKSAARHEAIQRVASLAQLERLCALGRVAAGVAEELTDPLSSALMSLDLLKAELDPLYASLSEVRALCAEGAPIDPAALFQVVARVRSQGTARARMQSVFDELSQTCAAIARISRELELEPSSRTQGLENHEYVDLREALDTILRVFRRATLKTHIERDYADDLPDVLVPRARIAQVLISLVANASASVRDLPGEVPRLRVSLRANDQQVTLTVSDSGRSLSPDALESGFESAGSTLRPLPSRNHHMAFELSAARAIMRSLGGDLMLESLGGEGTTLVAWLPRPKERFVRVSETVPKPDNQVRPLVLVIEPDPQVLSALSHLLGQRYEVLLALTGKEARRLLERGSRPAALLVAADEEDGAAFVGWLLGSRSDLARKLLLTTTQGELAEPLHTLAKLDKPIEPAALFRAIDELQLPPLRKARPVDEARSVARARRA